MFGIKKYHKYHELVIKLLWILKKEINHSVRWYIV